MRPAPALLYSPCLSSRVDQQVCCLHGRLCLLFKIALVGEYADNTPQCVQLYL